MSDQRQPFLQKNGYEIVQCQGCGFLYVHPRPNREELEAFYQNPIYFQGNDAYGYSAYFDEREEIQRRAMERLMMIERFVRRGRLLDVGCASGYFLSIAKARGWQVEGVEVSQVVAPSAEQLLDQRIHPTLDAFAAAPESFDVVTLWEYIEHVIDPRDELLRVRRLLKPDGLLALSTPNAGQLRVRRNPGAWREFKPPEHLGFFSVETVTRLLHACGFASPVIGAISPDIRPPNSEQQLIDLLRQRFGDRHTRTTRYWWIYSVVRRLFLARAWLHHRTRLSSLDYCKGIEVYARKDIPTRINTDERRF
ncbi:MAG: class I SAM-dependent methyltransferase [Acidobacteria bacterium]|nr:class I SAM-dependent methyltransferase [Acidobacteriota bacterium]